MSSLVQELNDNVLSMRLHRPGTHNALDEALVEELCDAFDSVRASTARVVLLSGEGKSFCSGADMETMRRQGQASLAENERAALRLGALFEKIDTCPLPVVARVQGAAVGGGVGLVAACDIAVAEASATFSLAEVRLGLVPAVISPYLLRRIGLGHARDLVLTGRKILAGEALRIGLVHRIAETGQLATTVDDVVRELKAGGPEAIARAKRLLREVDARLNGPRDALSSFTAHEIAEARASKEGCSGTSAFLAKKPPPWSGKGE